MTNALPSPLGYRGIPGTVTRGQQQRESFWPLEKEGFHGKNVEVRADPKVRRREQPLDDFAQRQEVQEANREHWRDLPDGLIIDQAQPRRKESKLERLERAYVIRDSELLSQVIEESPFLGELLWEALAQLDSSFGTGSIKKVEVIPSDEDSLIRVVACNPSSGPADAEAELRNFVRQWWLHNCHRSDGSLVFDYESGYGV